MAHDPILHQKATLKYLLDCAKMKRREISTFSEATKQSLFENDPRIVQVFDIGEGIAVENLLDQLRELPNRDYFEVDEIKDWIRLVCMAYMRVHCQEISPAGEAADVEISSETARTVTRLTGFESVFSASYGSPEQALGLKGDEKQDVYMVGALIYDLLTGRPPFFQGDVLQQIQHTTPPPLSERRREFGISGGLIPRRWESMVHACLSKNPEERPGFEDLMSRFFAKPGPVRPLRKRSHLITKVAAALLLVGGVAALSVYKFEDALTYVEKRENVLQEETVPVSLSIPTDLAEEPLFVTVLAPAAEEPSMIPDMAGISLPEFADASRPSPSLFPDGIIRIPKPAKKLVGMNPPEPGESFHLDDIGMDMMWVDPIKAWVAKSEVTSDQFSRGGGSGYRKFSEEKRARDSVSWNQAMLFCEALTRRERERGSLPGEYIYTLPTEAQWKVFVGDSSRSTSVYGHSVSEGPSEPGSKACNQYDLVDVRGNLWEWTLDDHTPRNKNRGKALRGGSYSSKGKLIMDKNARYYGAKDLSFYQYGFRFILTRPISS